MSRVQTSDRFVERMGASLTAAGLARLPARVFCALLVDGDGSMTSAELGEQLDISAGGVSGAIRYLERIGLVHREREPGSRRDRYVVDDDAWVDALMRKDQTYVPMIAILRSTLDALGPRDPAYRRLLLTVEFLEFVDIEMDGVVKRWARRRREIERSLDAE